MLAISTHSLPTRFLEAFIRSLVNGLKDRWFNIFTLVGTLNLVQKIGLALHGVWVPGTQGPWKTPGVYRR